jgi:osmoprotectant transport system ATP-binding protein
VVVLQLGGRIAQAGPPAELLAAPANDFVARFVGADRGLKRLSLFRVGDIPLDDATTVTIGDSVASVRIRAQEADATEVLLVDGDGRPVGWIPTDHLPADGAVDESLAVAKSPFLDRRTTLKDAMSLLLDADVPAGIVIDRHGRGIGLLTFQAVVSALRDDRFRGVDPDAVAPGTADATAGGADAPKAVEPAGVAARRVDGAAG